MATVYLIGSLRNPDIPQLAQDIRAMGFEAFASWYAAGPEADDYWKKYEQERGLSYADAIEDYAAQHVVAFDKTHLDRCDIAVLVGPAGKSGHLELGYAIGSGKRTVYYLPEEPEKDRWDVMPALADAVVVGREELLKHLKPQRTPVGAMLNSDMWKLSEEVKSKPSYLKGYGQVDAQIDSDKWVAYERLVSYGALNRKGKAWSTGMGSFQSYAVTTLGYNLMSPEKR